MYRWGFSWFIDRVLPAVTRLYRDACLGITQTTLISCSHAYGFGFFNCRGGLVPLRFALLLLIHARLPHLFGLRFHLANFLFGCLLLFDRGPRSQFDRPGVRGPF